MPKEQSASKVRAKIRWGVVGILGLFLVTLVFDVPGKANQTIGWVNSQTGIGLPTVPNKPFKLGLDLQGGTELAYQADVSNIPVTDRGNAVEGVRDVIERRVNGLGIGEPNIETSKVGEDYRINVELPGVTDVKTAIAMIGETPTLEFKEQDTTPPRALTLEEKTQLDRDNAAAKVKADGLLKQVLGGGDFAALAKANSDDAASKTNGGYMGYVDINNLYHEIYLWAAKVKIGDISTTLIKTVDGYNIVKRGNERDGAVQDRASHILICYLGVQGCSATMTKDEAKQKAEELYQKATADNFATLAKENSTDPGTKDKGGDLGYFPKGAMVAPFDAAVFAAKVGTIVGPVETQFGFHIIYKTGEQTPKEYEISRILARTKTASDIVPPKQNWKSTGLSGKQLTRAEVVTDPQTGAVQVSLQFDSEGTKLFKDITTRNVGKPVAIFLDGNPISIPTVNQPIPDGRAVITGQYTLSDARLLAQRLNAGALPVPVELISQQSLGASLGEASLAQSVKAGIIGVLLVMLFMIGYYRLPGVISALALTLYISVTLTIFKLFGITLSLAGIAGFIMSIGLAVDANVLIFERTKEELKAEKSLRTAVEEGFLRAWPSIRDSNVSTLITALILIWFGSSFVKGFAVTLAFGVLVSMFSAITVSRVLLRFVVPWFSEFGNWLFLGAKKKVTPLSK